VKKRKPLSGVRHLVINCPVLSRANFRCGSHPERGFHLSKYYTFNEGQADGGNISRRHATPDIPGSFTTGLAGFARVASSLEQLGINVSERFEFQRIIAWIQQNHRGLFARKSQESCIGLDEETDVFPSEYPDEHIPLIHLEHDTKVRYRHGKPVNRITVSSGAIPNLARRSKMSDQLMSIKIEIHPGTGTASLRAAQQPRVEITRHRNIIYPDGQVERRHTLPWIWVVWLVFRQ
jgi:hypothetical protein